MERNSIQGLKFCFFNVGQQLNVNSYSYQNYGRRLLGGVLVAGGRMLGNLIWSG